MATDDFDIDDLLEAPYKPPGQEENDERKKENGTSKKKSSRRSRSRSKDKKRRSRSRDRKRSDRRSDHRRRSRSKERSGSKRRSPANGRRRSPTPPRRHRSRSGSRRRSRSPVGGKEVIRRSRDGVTTISLLSDREREWDEENVSQEERDARTVFIMQLSRNVTIRDIQDFFNKVGSVRDVRLISDRNSKRSKGIGYVEFTEAKAVPAAIKVSGTKLLGVPIMVSPTMAEKNRLAAAQAAMVKPQGPLRLYIGSLHTNITEIMLRAIFDPFGTVDSVSIKYDDKGQSQGYGFVVFKDAGAGRRALEQMNGFELAGKAIKVASVSDRTEGPMSYLDAEETEKGGIEMSAQSRSALMQKLAGGSGMNIPGGSPGLAFGMPNPVAPPGPCILLSNLFNPQEEKDPHWDMDYRNDVLEELKKFGIVVHMSVDKISVEGNIYVKCLVPDVAAKIIESFNGRWFAGRTIRAVTVPTLNYHTLFPDAMAAVRPLKHEST